MGYLITNKVKRAFLNDLTQIIRDSGSSVSVVLGPDYSIDLYISYRRGQVVVRVQIKGQQEYVWIVISDGQGQIKNKRRIKGEFYFKRKTTYVKEGFYSVGFKEIDPEKFLGKIQEIRELLERKCDKERLGVSEMTEMELSKLRQEGKRENASRH